MRIGDTGFVPVPGSPAQSQRLMAILQDGADPSQGADFATA